MKDFEDMNDSEMEYAIMTGEFGSEVRDTFFIVCIDGLFGMTLSKPKAIKTIKKHLRTGWPLKYGYLDAESADGPSKYKSRLEFTCSKPR